MEFSEKLQQLRKQRNLTQEELARRLYVSRTAISKWESGRGYPGIESLKAIAKAFSVSVDELLSGEELLILAESEGRDRAAHLRDLVFGILDCLMGMLFFLPVFGLTSGDRILSVPLSALADASVAFVWISYVVLLSLTVALGLCELALQNVRRPLWLTGKRAASLALGILLTLLFIASGQPYAAAFAFFTLLVKGALLLKLR